VPNVPSLIFLRGFFLIECLKNGVEEMFKGTLLSAIGKTMYKDDRVKAVRIQLFPLL